MKKYLKYVIAFVCVAAVLVAAGITCGLWGISTHKVDCSDCGGLGYLLCEDGDAACNACAGAKVYDCDTCKATGQVSANSDLYATFWSLIPPV